MKLNKSIKILIGLGTFFYLGTPLLAILVWLTSIFSAVLGANNYGGEPTWLFFVFFLVFFPLMLLAGFTSIILIPVYLIHIIKNSQGKDSLRILTAMGLHYLPWLAMPFYFFVYIWPENPPAWALSEEISTAVEPNPEPVLYDPNEYLPEQEIKPEPAITPEPEAAQETEASEPVNATVVSWKKTEEPEPAPEIAAVEEQPGKAEQAMDLQTTDDIAADVSASATLVNQDLTTLPAPDSPETEAVEKPARKSRRKKPAQTETEVPSKTSPDEDSPSNADATMIGRSPVETESGDEA